MCIRNWKVPLRYKILDVSDDYKVKLGIRNEYKEFRKGLLQCQKKINKWYFLQSDEKMFSQELVAELKEIMAGCGQANDMMGSANS
jgi:hypothetical protein